MILYVISAFILLLIIVLISIICIIYTWKNIEGFEINYYISELGVNKERIQSNLFDKNVIKLYDSQVYEREITDMNKEELIYNSKPVDCVGQWVKDVQQCDGISNQGQQIFKYNIITPRRSTGQSCPFSATDTSNIAIINCPNDMLKQCPAGINAPKCISINYDLYMKYSGNDYVFNRDFISNDDQAIVALLLWQNGVVSWSGFIHVKNSEFQFIQIANIQATSTPNVIQDGNIQVSKNQNYITINHEYPPKNYRSNLIISKNNVGSMNLQTKKLNYIDTLFRFGIPVNEGIVNKNLQTYGDQLLIALLIWSDNGMLWTGFVGINHYNNNQHIYDKLSGTIDLSYQDNHIRINNWVDPNMNINYKTRVLVSKNNIENTPDISSTKRVQFQQSKSAYGIYMNGELYGTNFINNGDLLMIALHIWTDTGKFWMGIVSINHAIYAGKQTFRQVLNQDISLDTEWDGGGGNYIIIRNVSVSDGGIYYRTNILVSKNNIKV